MQIHAEPQRQSDTTEHEQLKTRCQSECKLPRRHPFDCRPVERTEINEARYWAKIEKGEGDGCWLWIGAKNGQGYGCFGIQGRSFLAHRIAVILSGEDIPSGFLIDHLCRNRACCNPAHLRVATPKQNGENTAAAEKTHCVHGHEFTEANTFRKNGMRQCRACKSAMQKRWKEKRRSLLPHPARMLRRAA